MPMQSALELSTPAREPLGIWSLGTPAKPGEVRQSLTSKAYSLGRTFEKAWELGKNCGEVLVASKPTTLLFSVCFQSTK